MKQFITLVLQLLTASEAIAGSGMSGGTPPSRQQLEEQLMSAEKFHGAIFDNGLGDVGLLTNGELQNHIVVTKSQFYKADIKVSEADFEVLRDRKKLIDAIGAFGENKSYQIFYGDHLDSLFLTDRRALAREAICK